MTFVFGEHVVISHRLNRRASFDGNVRRKDWHAEPLSKTTSRGAYQRPLVEEAPVRGIVVGKRTLTNGTTFWGGEDGPVGYEPDSKVIAHLVATDMNAAPVYVLEEHITHIPFAVGQIVSHDAPGTNGIVIDVRLFSETAPHLGDYVVVRWDYDEDGALGGGWIVIDPDTGKAPPLHVLSDGAPEAAPRTEDHHA